jgi:hypothetical protein
MEVVIVQLQLLIYVKLELQYEADTEQDIPM